jgi:hypothetical protein
MRRSDCCKTEANFYSYHHLYICGIMISKGHMASAYSRQRMGCAYRNSQTGRLNHNPIERVPQVMEFVNSIARIVHAEVSHRGGSANKNIGDAFLLVWKLGADYSVEGAASIRRSIRASTERVRLA